MGCAEAVEGAGASLGVVVVDGCSDVGGTMLVMSRLKSDNRRVAWWQLERFQSVVTQ